MFELMSNFVGMLMFAEMTGDITKGLAYLGSGIAAIGCLGAGIGQGYTGGKAVEAVSRNPEVEGKVRTLFIVAAAISESGAIYALVISIILAFVVA
ncbi:F0F1 ATP synthase subunit C [Spiroplasma syrphidicola EA-1]|uniref:ATP synthase subunit c n=2 Tax=Spiroplasma TaxID=2132 RepID=R4UKA5_9MOLU|nr:MULTISPECIES: ATP synthase F0 subunit C [Spiroplasma]AGM24672.1 F0F1 ATP synthase subunit C [Spiroplasma chrysopicola DF-1]AGM25701.1 F0F1 ATP synthase subunit C [Spiroplasma syrphidicola EA-1]